MMIKNKICVICNLRKSINDFYFRKDNGCYRLQCKSCWLKIQKKYYTNNKKERRQYYQINKKDVLLKKKKFYVKNHDKLLSEKKLYNKEHRTERTQYRRIRLKTDINFKIASNMRTRIYSALKGNTKSLSTMFLIGCEVDYLLYYIQNKFKNSMTWDNYGRGDNNKKEWNIDHIKPCASFDLSKKSEQQKCFNHKNLQPLWAKENKQKLNKEI